MGSNGHSGMHAPQSMQVSGSMYIHGHSLSGLPGTMHSTGQTSMQPPSRRHRLVMMWVIEKPPGGKGRLIQRSVTRAVRGPPRISLFGGRVALGHFGPI